jgi:small GTP-binding protein
MIENNKTEVFRIVMLGSGCVGKSSLTLQFIKGNFYEKFDPSCEEYYSKKVEVDGKEYLLEILDTAGPEEYSAIRDKFMRTGHGFVLAYSITDPSSFQDIEVIHEQLLKSVDSDSVPTVLIGNKCDLENDRAVTIEEGQKLSKTFGECKFYETSAKERINVEESFYSLIRLINSRNDIEENKIGDIKEKEKGNKKCLIL